MQLGMAECHLLFSGHCDVDLWPSFNNYCVRSISLILFEIENWVRGCIMGWRSVVYLLWVTVTLTSVLFFRIIVSKAYLILLQVGIPNLVCRCNFGWWSVTYHFRITLTLTSDLVCRIIVSRPYLLHHLRWESQIGVWLNLGMMECRVPFKGHCSLKLDFDLVYRIIISGAYLFYHLSWETQIWCVTASLNGGLARFIFRSLCSWPLT